MLKKWKGLPRSVKAYAIALSLISLADIALATWMFVKGDWAFGLVYLGLSAAWAFLAWIRVKGEYDIASRADQS